MKPTIGGDIDLFTLLNMATNNTGATCLISNLFDEIKGHDIKPEEKDKVEEWISSCSDQLRIVVFGKTSVRKSILVNGFVGAEVIPEGEGREPQTLTITKSEKECPDAGIKIEVFDCSALQDGLFNADSQERHLHELQKKSTETFIY